MQNSFSVKEALQSLNWQKTNISDENLLEGEQCRTYYE